MHPVEPSRRQALERIRTLAEKRVPDVEETIWYSMPTLKHRGKPFLGCDSRKNHPGIYRYSGQVMDALRDRLGDSGRHSGARLAPLNWPNPESALKLIIERRLKQIDAEVKAKK